MGPKGPKGRRNRKLTAPHLSLRSFLSLRSLSFLLEQPQAVSCRRYVAEKSSARKSRFAAAKWVDWCFRSKDQHTSP